MFNHRHLLKPSCQLHVARFWHDEVGMSTAQVFKLRRISHQNDLSLITQSVLLCAFRVCLPACGSSCKIKVCQVDGTVLGLFMHVVSAVHHHVVCGIPRAVVLVVTLQVLLDSAEKLFIAPCIR